jgi:hypothetical protein
VETRHDATQLLERLIHAVVGHLPLLECLRCYRLASRDAE